MAKIPACLFASLFAIQFAPQTVKSPMQEHPEISSFEANRLARTGRIILICAAAWSGFGIYYLLNSRYLSGCHCLLEGVWGAWLAYRAWTKPERRLAIASCYVGTIVVGLTIESITNGLQYSLSPIFFCCSVLVASLTIGKRHAWKTVIAVFVSIIAVHYVLPLWLPPPQVPPMLDRVLALMTLLGVVAGCSYYAESTSEKFAKELERTSNQLRERTEQLDAIVGFDSLTSLPNRSRLHEDSVDFLSADSRSCLLLIDINDFKLINDRFGHAIGDDVLRQVSFDLQAALPGSSEIYRLGGDEFVVIARKSAPDIDFEQVIRTSAEALSQGVHPKIDGLKSHWKLGISIGAAFYPAHAKTLDELLSCADKAMYQAKADRRPVVLFESAMAEEAEKQRCLQEQLVNAIECEEFTLHYQPQVNIASNQIVGVEALLRWNRGNVQVSPAEFIPCLEQTGRIVEVGKWVIQKACEQIDCWRNIGYEVRVSVNVSSLQIQADGFADDVLKLLRRFDIPPHLLDLEITESLLLEHAEHANRNIEKLTQQGVYFSIDDFGTGYSSLAYLKQLPMDRLKIDRSFIKDIPSSDDGMIAETVITLAKHLDMAVVAEGVETEAQLEFLRERDCDEYQGFLFSRPVSAEACTLLIKRHSPERSTAILA